MNVHFDFGFIRKVLSSVAQIPASELEHSPLSQEAVEKIYQILSEGDQALFHKALVGTATEARLIYDFTQQCQTGEPTEAQSALLAHLGDLAYQNLKIMQMFELAATYFDLSKMDKFPQLSVEERCDVVGLVHSVANELPEQCQKEALFHMLRRLPPKDRHNASAFGPALSLAHMCMNKAFEWVQLKKFLKAPIKDRTARLQHVEKRVNFAKDKAFAKGGMDGVEELKVALGRMHLSDPAFFASKPNFQVAYEDFTNCPTNVLSNLVAFFDETHCSSFTVKFLHKAAVDGAVSEKTFLHGLVEGVCKELRFEKLPNGLLRPHDNDDSGEERLDSYLDLGVLFTFCLHSPKNVIGMKIDRSVFTAITLLKKRLWSLNLIKLGDDEQMFQAFYPIYKAMMSHNEEDRAALARMEASLNDPSTKKKLVEAMQNAIVPCQYLRAGMILSPYSSFVGLSAEELDKRIQGTVNAEWASK